MNNPQMMEEVRFGSPRRQSDSSILACGANSGCTSEPHFSLSLSLSLSLSVQMIRNHPLFAGNPQAAEMVSYKKKGRKERRRRGSECCGK